MKFAAASVLSCVAAQDPAHGWMAYAVGAIPSNYDRITKLEMSWTVGEAPSRSRAFFSPWFGMDPADNLNLVQPVNPWGGGSWSMYTEYFQWSPTKNSNSRQHSVEAGQTLHGTVEYVASSDSYTLSQEIVETGVTSSQVVKAQKGKKYTVPYVVYEKTWACSDYPADGIVTFRNITVECDGADCTQAVQWESKVMDANCGMAAHVEKGAKQTSENEISITWDTKAESRFDSWSEKDLIQHNAAGWGQKHADEALKMIEMEEKISATTMV